MSWKRGGRWDSAKRDRGAGERKWNAHHGASRGRADVDDREWLDGLGSANACARSGAWHSPGSGGGACDPADWTRGTPEAKHGEVFSTVDLSQFPTGHEDERVQAQPKWWTSSWNRCENVRACPESGTRGRLGMSRVAASSAQQRLIMALARVDDRPTRCNFQGLFFELCIHGYSTVPRSRRVHAAGSRVGLQPRRVPAVPSIDAAGIGFHCGLTRA